MPQCGCFHKYDLARIRPSHYELTLPMEGQANLKDILQNSGVAQSVAVSSEWFELTLTLSGVLDEAKLRGLLDILSSVIMIDLRPLVDECYALGPYSIFTGERSREQSTIGNLLNQAKYQRDHSANAPLRSKLEDFIVGHPTLSSVDCILAAPKSDVSTPDLAGTWAQDIAGSLGYHLVQATKIRQTEPQKELEKGETEDETAARVADSVHMEAIIPSARALIIDDTIRSGGTMKEIARALHQAGAKSVFGLSVAKDAKFTPGSIDLSKERWQ